MSDRVQSARHFHRLAARYAPEMRLLLRGGRLWKRDGWRPVVAHCLIQVAIAEELAELLGLAGHQARRLASTAAVHDWAKRLELRPAEFTQADRDRADRLLARVAVDPVLMAATGPSFLERALVRQEADWLEQLQFFIDDLCAGGTIVAWQARLDELERRKPELNADPELSARLGGRYWDKERELCTRVERALYAALVTRGVAIGDPAEVVVLIQDRIRARVLAGAG